MKLTIDISPQELKELTGMDKMEEMQRELIHKIIQQYWPFYSQQPENKDDPHAGTWTCGDVTAMFDPTKWPLYKSDDDKEH